MLAAKLGEQIIRPRKRGRIVVQRTHSGLRARMRVLKPSLYDDARHATPHGWTWRAQCLGNAVRITARRLRPYCWPPPLLPPLVGVVVETGVPGVVAGSTPGFMLPWVLVKAGSMYGSSSFCRFMFAALPEVD